MLATPEDEKGGVERGREKTREGGGREAGEQAMLEEEEEEKQPRQKKKKKQEDADDVCLCMFYCYTPPSSTRFAPSHRVLHGRTKRGSSQ